MPEVGQNVPVVTTTVSQATPPVNSVSPAATLTRIQPGTGSTGDDGQTMTAIQAVSANGAFDNEIIPRENILSRYASYTYSLTWYLMTPEALAQLQSGDYSVLSSQTIIMQSGGINNDQRNAIFDVDFYFEDLKFKSVLPGGSGGASSDYELEFTVIEPNGITLIPRLQKSIDTVMGTASGKTQMIGSQNYVMAIRYYGYDSSGNLIQVGNPLNSSGDSALVQKILPFAISDFEYKVANKLVEYHFKAGITGPIVAQSTNQNSLMYNVELSGMTVKEILTTGTTVTTGSNPGNNPTENTGRISDGATTKNTVRLGLVSALNQYQQDLVKQGAVTYPHTYIIEFTDDEIANAQVAVKDGRTRGTGMPIRGSAPDKLDPRRQSMDSTVRLMDFTAGQQITQIIEQTVRNSTYITDQSNMKISETTQMISPKDSGGLYWFKISFQSTPKTYDPKRNDYAYTIRYVVSKYRILHVISPYVKPCAYPGVHKSYEYWFTGLNTEVLHYEQKFTPQQTLTIGNQGDTGSLETNETYKQNPAPRSSQTSQGAAGRTNDISANAADFLYSPGDMNPVEIQILGDPAWIPQGEVVGLPNANNWNNKGFHADGSINTDGGQILFEVAFSAPADYDLSTGLMDPDTQISGMIDNVGQQNQARQRIIFLATEVESTFSKGEFTQLLKGSIRDEESKLRKQQIDASIGKETRSGVFDKTPNRRLLTASTATNNLVTGGIAPSIGATNINPQTQVNALQTFINVLPSPVAQLPTSNGTIEILPATGGNLVTNTVTQLINRDT